MKNTITPLVVKDVTGLPRIRVTMPRLNKNDTLDQNRKEVDAGHYIEDAAIERVVVLSDADYRTFCKSLLTDQDWLNDKGGSNSDYDCPEGVTSIWQLTTEQLNLWRRQAYIFVVVVAKESDPHQHLLVDPQGYAYARYAGEPTDTESRQIAASAASAALAEKGAVTCQ